MDHTSQASLPTTLGRGVVCGLAGTAVMTVVQKAVEMPLTGRDDSDAPAQFAQRVLPLTAKGRKQHKQLNYVIHFALGTMWGAAYGFAAHNRLRGQAGVGAVFGAVYTGDVLLNTALGLYEPRAWSTQDWVIDIGHKLVQAEATGVIYDRVFARR